MEKKIFAIRYDLRNAYEDFDFLYEGAKTAINSEYKHLKISEESPFDETCEHEVWHELLTTHKLPLEALLNAVKNQGEWIEIERQNKKISPEDF